MNVLVTGASGFVGGAVISKLCESSELNVAGVLRRTHATQPRSDVHYVEISDIGPDTKWGEAVSTSDVVIHAAGRAHVVDRKGERSSTEFERVNVLGTLRLAQQAADAGVRRFIYLSSIKVNGDVTAPGMKFGPEHAPAPEDAYSKSKHAAERALQELSQACDMELVVIRPPLVYGPGVRANFLAMLRWIHKGWPLPLGRVHNRRSLVALDNLVDLIEVCVGHPAAANQIFTVSDDDDVSTGELAYRMGRALNRRARLYPVPARLLRAGAVLAGRRALADRLLGSLIIDISKARHVLGWSPVVTMDQALSETARHYLENVAE